MYKLALGEFMFPIILWVIAFFKYKSALKPLNHNKGNYILFGFILVLYSTFAFSSGDFLHYYKLYNNLARGYFDDSMEEFYNCLIEILPTGYYWWRLAVWGLSSLILITIYKRLNCPANLSCLVFVLVLMFSFPNLRNALGYVVLYFSLTFVFIPLKIKTLSYTIAVMGGGLSLFLHKSMPLYIMCMLLSFIPLGKKMYIASLIAFPFIYLSFAYFSSYILSLDLGEGAFISTGASYLEGEHFSKLTIYGYIQLVIARLPLLVLLYYVISNVLKGNLHNRFVEFFSRYTYILVYLSCVFFNQETSSFLSNRFWDASLYPMALIFPLSFYQRDSKLIKVCFYLLLVANLYNLAYSIYKF